VAPSNQAEAQLYQHTHQLLQAHATLLRDGRRQRPFYRALKKKVRPESSVLDIGAGTGLWSIVAAQLGARRVVAIEQDPMLAGLIQALAHANGVADRIEVITGDSRQIELGKEFDLLVTETIGYLGFDENIASIVMDARTRFLKTGGAIIPETIALQVAGARCRPRTQGAIGTPAGLTVDYTYFDSLLLHSPAGLKQPLPITLMTPPRLLVEAELLTLDAPPNLAGLTAHWEAQASRAIDGFVVWAEARLAKGVRLSTLRSTSWEPILYRIQPFQEESGDLEFQLTLTHATNYWTATLKSDKQHEVRSYSPALAAAELVARARGGGSVLSHNQRLGLLPS